MNESQETDGTLVITGSDAAKFLQFQAERLYQMALLVQVPVHIPRVGIVTLGRNTEIGVMIGNELSQFPFSVGFISQNGHSRAQIHRFQHLLRNLHIMHVSG